MTQNKSQENKFVDEITAYTTRNKHFPLCRICLCIMMQYRAIWSQMVNCYLEGYTNKRRILSRMVKNFLNFRIANNGTLQRHTAPVMHKKVLWKSSMRKIGAIISSPFMLIESRPSRKGNIYSIYPVHMEPQQHNGPTDSTAQHIRKMYWNSALYKTNNILLICSLAWQNGTYTQTTTTTTRHIHSCTQPTNTLKRDWSMVDKNSSKAGERTKKKRK